MNRSDIIASARKVVIKVGSGVLTSAEGLDHRRVDVLSGQISRLARGGRQVVLVSSGAVASGRAKAGLVNGHMSIPQKQAAAALGQSGLMQAYEEAFREHGIKVAQVLLTSTDLTERDRYLNARNTLFTLLEWGVIPIVNENDTVAVDEIKLGDNDNLAAMLTNLLGADLLINLTNVDGILDDDPRVNPRAQLIQVVEKVDAELLRAASAQPGAVGRGGILTKVQAAEKVARCGTPTIVANGLSEGILDRLVQGEQLGTLFLPHGAQLSRRKHWIAFTAEAKGEVLVDQGAVKPLREGGKSLLAAGVRQVTGPFEAGAAVRVLGPDGAVLGIGLSNYSSNDLEKIKGLRSSEIEKCLGHKDFDEVIHRDNLAVFTGDEEESLACLLRN